MPSPTSAAFHLYIITKYAFISLAQKSLENAPKVDWIFPHRMAEVSKKVILTLTFSKYFPIEPAHSMAEEPKEMVLTFTFSKCSLFKLFLPADFVANRSKEVA